MILPSISIDRMYRYSWELQCASVRLDVLNVHPTCPFRLLFWTVLQLDERDQNRFSYIFFADAIRKNMGKEKYTPTAI
ncbi:MAG: hypothetical protein R6V55_10005 [Desulfovermiculus sp.]